MITNRPSRSGFTLIELIIFVAIFTVVIVSFVGILVSTLNVQTSQSAVNEVDQQGQFLLQQIQQDVSSAQFVNMVQDSTTSTLVLGESSSSPQSYLTMSLASGTAYVMQSTNGLSQALTSNKVFVSQLSFTRHNNISTSSVYGTDSVSFSFTMTASSTNNKQYSQVFQSSVAVFTPGLKRVPFGTYISQFGASGHGEGQFNNANNRAGIAFDASGNVYVVDGGNERVEEFSSNGSFIMTFGWGVQDGASSFETCTSGCQAGISGTGNGQFGYPDGITIDSSGNIYVADGANSRIQKFSSSGAYLSQFGSYGTGSGQFGLVSAISIDASGNIYVADMDNYRVQKFSSSGSFITMWGWGVQDGASSFETCTSGCQAGISGSGNGQFSDNYSKAGIALDTSGNVYVADGSYRIQEFSSSGTYLAQFGSSGTGNGQFTGAVNVAIDPSGNIYGADIAGRIEKFSSGGAYLSQFGSSGSGTGQFNGVENLAINPGGNLYVTDGSDSRVEEFGGN